MKGNINICSINCQGLGDHTKRRDVFRYIKNKGFDMFLLQDTHFEKKNENLIRSEWGYECWFNSYTSRSRGVSILFNNTFEFKNVVIRSDDSGNFLIMKIEVDSISYVIANIYAPNRENPNFFRNIQTVINSFGENNIIIGGDWNCLLDAENMLPKFVRILSFGFTMT